MSLTCLNPSRSITSTARGSLVRLAAASACEDVVAEQGAIGEAGEAVVERLVLERLGVGLALRDVADDGEREGPIAVLHLRRARPPSGRSSHPLRRPSVSVARFGVSSSVGGSRTRRLEDARTRV